MTNVLEYLEKTAKKNPFKTAVADKNESFTFSELINAAKSIGNQIKKYSTVNKPIGVIAERNIHTIACIFGILYSGNFYVSIDPELPNEKFKYIINNAEISIVLSYSENRELVERTGLDEIFITPQENGNTQCDIPSSCDNLHLCLLYTSGSTGSPKGVLKSHHAMICFIESFTKCFNISEAEIIGNQTPFYFDASAKDIYLMLKNGNTLEIIPSELFVLPPELIDYLNNRKISIAMWVPTVLSIVAKLNPFSLVKPNTLKKVFFVGETMPTKVLNTWQREMPNIEYINLYGQTELAGVCCYYIVDRIYDLSETLPLGTPFNHCQMYLVDDGKVVTAPDETGEIYIVSDSLADEYYKDSVKTSECFFQKDFGNGVVRCFKTGDLAKYDRLKKLRFVSRNDYQIKHMGRRIELGEIEAIANGLEELSRCCCIYNHQKKKIMLFCTLNTGYDCSGKDIRRELKGRLSDYMLPAKVTVLESMPINANGKINRQQLQSLV